MYHFANHSRACTAWTNQITRELLGSEELFKKPAGSVEAE